jgi:hypothetical protein
LKTGTKIAIIISVLAIAVIIGVIAYIEYRNVVIAEETYKIDKVIDCIREEGSFCVTICEEHRNTNTGLVFKDIPQSECQNYINNVAKYL